MNIHLDKYKTYYIGNICIYRHIYRYIRYKIYDFISHSSTLHVQFKVKSVKTQKKLLFFV